MKVQYGEKQVEVEGIMAVDTVWDTAPEQVVFKSKHGWPLYYPQLFCDDVSTTNFIFECSNCGCEVDETGVDNGLVNFCPDCGKRVDR